MLILKQGKLNLKLSKEEKYIDFGEYKVLISYYGNGTIDITLFDELGDEIESIYVSDNDNDDDIKFNLN